jgi:hypothetical protein
MLRDISIYPDLYLAYLEGRMINISAAEVVIM